MADRGMKVVLAVSVLLCGTAGALLFRRTPPQPGAVAPVSAPPLLLRERGAAGDPADASSQAAPGDPFDAPRRAPPEAVSRPPSVLAPLDPGAPPPIMAKSYPRLPATANSRWGTSMALGPAEASEPEPRPLTHKIVDGDTLPDLARRYLGSADRYMEIYEANRYLLPGPDVLPIGVELKIPQPGRRPKAPDPAARGPLVPIPPSSLRPRAPHAPREAATNRTPHAPREVTSGGA